MGKKIMIDPEFKALIPALCTEDYEALEASLLKEGCRQPLVTWQDLLIDGHHRYAICKKHGIAFRIDTKKFESREKAMIWMIDNQLARRNLLVVQRVELALRKESMIAAQAKRNLVTSTGGAAPRPLENSPKAAIHTRDAVATAAGVSGNTVSKLKKIQKTAAPEVMSALHAGDISINAAAAVATCPIEEQALAAAGGKQELQALAKQAKQNAIIDKLAGSRRTTKSAPVRTAHAPAAGSAAGTAAGELDALLAENMRLRRELNEAHITIDQLRTELAALQHDACDAAVGDLALPQLQVNATIPSSDMYS